MMPGSIPEDVSGNVQPVLEHGSGEAIGVMVLRLGKF